MYTVLDQSADTNKQYLHKIVKLYSAPDFVKSANMQDLDATESLPLHCYALPAMRKFRCDTPAATWVSAAYLHTKKADYNKNTFEFVAKNIQKKAAYFGISPEVNELIKKIASDKEQPEEELLDIDFALIYYNNNNEKERHLPLRNREEVKAAAQYLWDYRDEFPYEMRFKIAESVLEKAAEYGASIGEHEQFIEKQAGCGTCPAADIAEMLWTRVRAIGSIHKPNQEQVELVKLAKQVLTNPEKTTHPDARVKIATIVDNLDRAYSLKYEGAIQRPEDVIFAITTKDMYKVATEHVSLTNGSIYNTSDLNKVAVSDIRDVMGEEFTDSVTAGGLFVDPEKIAEVAPTLPRGDADLFEKALGISGVQPVAKEASMRVGLTTADVLRLAKYREEQDSQSKRQTKTAAAKAPIYEPTNRGAAISFMAQTIRNKMK